MNKIPISADRLELAARALCEMRGIDPDAPGFVPDTKYPPTPGRATPVKEKTALDVMKYEISVYIQVLTAVEHAYITIPDEAQELNMGYGHPIPETEIPWAEAQRICDLPNVDAAIRGFLEDQTGDNATGMVHAILAAVGHPKEQAFPERDLSKPAEQQGLFRKFEVRRVDGSDQPGGKHYGCRYYVLDLDHDKAAPAAMRTYAAEVKESHPELSKDIEAEFGIAVCHPIQPAPAAFGIFLQSGKFIDAQEDEAFAKTVAGEFEGVVKPMYLSAPEHPALPKSQFPSAIEWQAAMNEIQPAPAADNSLLPAVLALNAAIHKVLCAGGDYGDDLSDYDLRKTLEQAQHVAFRALISIGIDRLPGAVNPLSAFLPKGSPEQPATAKPRCQYPNCVCTSRASCHVNCSIRAQALEEAAKVCDDDYEISRGNYEITRSPYSEGAKDTADRIATEIRSIHTSPDSS